jgi:hypothetical protein
MEVHASHRKAVGFSFGLDETPEDDEGAVPDGRVEC